MTNQEVIYYAISSLVFLTVVFIIKRKLTNLFHILKSGFIKLILWIKPSFEDDNHIASSRRLAAFTIIMIYMYSRILFMYHVTDPYYLLLGSIVDALFALLLFGIVTIQNIIALKNGVKGFDKENLNLDKIKESIPDLNSGNTSQGI